MRKNKEKNKWNTLMEATNKANIVQLVTFNQATWIGTVLLTVLNTWLHDYMVTYINRRMTLYGLEADSKVEQQLLLLMKLLTYCSN